MDVAVFVYVLTAGLLAVGAVVLLVDPRPLFRLLQRVRQGLAAAFRLERPWYEDVDYPGGVARTELQVWADTVADLSDLTEVAPRIVAAYLPAGVTR